MHIYIASYAYLKKQQSFSNKLLDITHTHLQEQYRYAVLKQLFPDKTLSIQKTDMGKPYIEEYVNIQISQSHTKNYFAFAVHDQSYPFGIDIEEKNRPIRYATMKYASALEDFLLIQNSTQPNNAFLKQWTTKEALAKALGTGLNEEILKSSLLQRSNKTGYFHQLKYQDWIFYQEQFETLYLSIVLPKNNKNIHFHYHISIE